MFSAMRIRSVRMKALWFLAFALALTTAPEVAAAQAAPAQPGSSDSLGADWGAQQDEAREGVRQGRYVPLAGVIAEIRRRSPGAQLDVGLEQAGGRAVYRVRWAAADGRRIDYIVDASTGAIITADGK
jgi:uncharacterized membrane protein YkoI